MPHIFWNFMSFSKSSNDCSFVQVTSSQLNVMKLNEVTQSAFLEFLSLKKLTFSLIWHFGIKRQDHLQRDRSKIQLGYFMKVKNFKEENQLVPSHKSGLKWAWSKFFGLKLDELWISDQKKRNKVSRPVWVKCRVCPVLYEQRWLLNVVWQLTVCLSKGACRRCVSTREKHVFKLI